MHDSNRLRYTLRTRMPWQHAERYMCHHFSLFHLSTCWKRRGFNCMSDLTQCHSSFLTMLRDPRCNIPEKDCQMASRLRKDNLNNKTHFPAFTLLPNSWTARTFANHMAPGRTKTCCKTVRIVRNNWNVRFHESETAYQRLGQGTLPVMSNRYKAISKQSSSMYQNITWNGCRTALMNSSLHSSRGSARNAFNHNLMFVSRSWPDCDEKDSREETLTTNYILPCSLEEMDLTV